MRHFKNILVGVDLSAGDRFVSGNIKETTKASVERAIWLAKLNDARLTFIYSLELPSQLRHMAEAELVELPLVEKANRVLKKMADQAEKEGITAESVVRIGTGWVELIRQVLQNQHDLLIVGTRHLGSVASLLIGSTGTKLLRKCPCPVWVIQPRDQPSVHRILVAHDLSEVGTAANHLAGEMAELEGAEIFVIHALETEDTEGVSSANANEVSPASRRTAAKEQISNELAVHELVHPTVIEIVENGADDAILDAIESYHPNLIVMGTVVRTGVARLLMGNTAERLLPRLSCSVLAVKPKDFISPVTV